LAHRPRRRSASAPRPLFALEHEATIDVHASNLTWGVGGLLFSVVNDGIQMGAFA
jgi:hypothetical protein